LGQTPVTSLLPDLGLCREVGASSTHTQSALAIWDTLRVKSQARAYLKLPEKRSNVLLRVFAALSQWVGLARGGCAGLDGLGGYSATKKSTPRRVAASVPPRGRSKGLIFALEGEGWTSDSR